ncbi:MAG: hypothetical protein GF411_16695 [Candidatus Lokiarchaeota archaeon]|nr:hypothetical protein [Candidatus Lokiarchaeota archaeon]
MKKLEYFLKHVYIQDYVRSSTVLQEVFKTNLVEEFSLELQNRYKQFEQTLSIRNHVAFFLNMTPAYFALKLPSHEILSLVDRQAQDIPLESIILNCIHEYLTHDEDIVSTCNFDITLLSSTQYARLVPDLILKRMDKLRNCKIPFIEKSNAERTIYGISDFTRTSFGRRILLALEISPTSVSISKKNWIRIAKALESLEIQPDEMLIEKTQDEWFQYLDTLSERKEPIFEECVTLNHTYDQITLLESPNQNIRLKALENLEHIECIGHMYQMRKIVAEGSIKQQQKAISIIALTGLPWVANYLTKLLQTGRGEIRKAAAKALSEYSSKSFTKGIRDLSSQKEQLVKVGLFYSLYGKELNLERLDFLASHKNPLVRLEVTKSVTSSAVKEFKPIIRKLLLDKERRIRLQLAEQIHSMEEENARMAIETLQHDPDIEVRETALKNAEKRWREEEGLSR